MKVDVFISSNLKEFKKERQFLMNSIRDDPTFDNYFDVYIYEEDSAKSKSTGKVFTTRVEHSDIHRFDWKQI